MKKTLVALAVMAVAGSANAGIELYKKDAVSVTMGGDIEVVYIKGLKDGSELQQEIQDADVSFDVRYAVNDQVQFGGFWEFQDLGDNKGDAYVAAYAGAHTFKVGKLCTSLDDAGIGSDYQFGLETFFSESEVYCDKEVMRYDFDSGDFYATAALRQFRLSEDLNKDSKYYDGRIGYRGLKDFDFTAFVGSADLVTHDETLWSLQARYNGVENLGLAAAYYSMDNDTVTTSTIAFAATYKLDVVKLAAGVAVSDSDEAGAKDVTGWYVNAGYPLAPNATLYAEVGANDAYSNVGTEQAPVMKQNGTGFAFGVKASF
ncbi:Outer membrane protein OmpT [Vibrio vulnificus]|uniref:Outer membrane protein OmpT n=1 Tax=Vibrio vulnificus (strain CMCP6) TaxID=216895 RepID=A0A3Q0L515_VIBVU|nr:porin [Vibrio vulnificus]AAO10502.2 Outer membrane protein OmpT [Vibrio vulnificus CMCP6]ELV8653905.1 porin [Vibrio vulnificus]MCA3977648.1 porin [Vibrio vulnificus]MCA4003813.1 porin [Vibrio vulnificus]QBN14543.1 porin [Vibrio vulnificus]